MVDVAERTQDAHSQEFRQFEKDVSSRDISAPSGVLGLLKIRFDTIVAGVFVILLSPFFVVISMAILIEDRGTPIFFQPRFGKGGKPFNVLKFRTMRRNNDTAGAKQTQDNDPRITRVGYILRKTSLDELPQLLNVLFGKMSLVGPRAHPCEMRVQGILCEVMAPAYHDRHIVRPGITGWAQINGSRGAVKDEGMLQRRLDLDLAYIRNWSPILDLKIIWRTFAVVASCKEAR